MSQNFIGYVRFIDISSPDESLFVADSENPINIVSTQFIRCTSNKASCITLTKGKLFLTSCFFEECQTLTIANNNEPNVMRLNDDIVAQHVELRRCAPTEKSGDSPIRSNKKNTIEIDCYNSSGCFSFYNFGGIFCEDVFQNIKAARVIVEKGYSDRVFYLEIFGSCILSFFNIINNTVDMIFETTLYSSSSINANDFYIFGNSQNAKLCSGKFSSFTNFFSNYKYTDGKYFVVTSSTVTLRLNIVPYNKNTKKCRSFAKSTVLACLLLANSKLYF